MRAIILLLFGVLLTASQLRAQLFLEIPEGFRYDINKSMPYVKKQLNNSKTDSEYIKWLCSLSALYNKQGQYAFADSLLLSIKVKEALPKELKVRVFLAKAITKKFGLYPAEAYEDYLEALDIAKSLNDKGLLIEVYIELAEFHRKLENFEAALKAIENALSHLEPTNPYQYNLAAYAYGRKAAILNQYRTSTSSIEASLQSLHFSKKVNNSYLEATSYNELGYSYKHLRKIDSALANYKRSEETFRKSGMIVDATHVRFNTLEFCSHNNLYEDSLLTWLLDFIHDVETMNIPYSLRMPYMYVHIQYVQKEDWEKAYKAYYRFHEIFDQELTARRQKEVDNIFQDARNREIREENEKIIRELNDEKALVISQKRKILWTTIALICLLILVFLFVRLFLKSRRMAKELIKKNAEKDLLIQEVHHRVKNNLNFIHSLLEIQEGNSNSIEEAIALKEASIRISSVSQLHKMLYLDDHSGKLDVAQYTDALINNLRNTFENESKPVQIEIDIDEVEMNIQECTAFGLLVTECFTNSVKHAFQEVDKPFFGIRLKHKPNVETTLRIVDNGQTSMVTEKSDYLDSLGLRLIEIFSRQLNGTYTLSFENGFCYLLNFSLDER